MYAATLCALANSPLQHTVYRQDNAVEKLYFILQVSLSLCNNVFKSKNETLKGIHILFCIFYGILISFFTLSGDC